MSMGKPTREIIHSQNKLLCGARSGIFSAVNALFSYDSIFLCQNKLIWIIRFGVFVFALIGSNHSKADPRAWQVGGFVSQAGVYTSDNYFFGNTDDRVNGQFGEYGIIINGNISDSIDLSSQVISRRAGEIADGSPKFDYANLAFHFDSRLESSQTFRLGRIKTPIGFFNELRESPFTRPGIFLPQGMYWDRFRNSRSFYNGGQYTYEHSSELNVINIKLGVGQIKADKNEFESQIGISGVAELKPAKTYQFAITNDYDGGRIRSSLTAVQFKTGVSPSSANSLFSRSAKLEYIINVASLEYNANNWSVTGEYLRGITDTGSVGAMLPGYEEHPEVSFCQFTYRLTSKMEYFLRYESQVADRNDPRGQKYITDVFGSIAPLLAQLNIPFTPAFSRYAFDKTIGFAWHPSNEMVLRFEWHHVIGEDWVSNYLINKNVLTSDWDLIALQASYRF